MTPSSRSRRLHATGRAKAALLREPTRSTGGGFDLKKGLEYASTIVGLLAPAALFYAAGYVINQAYLISVGINATFWFNEFFYREAGARLVLDVLAALLLLPHVMLPLSAALFVLLPTPGRGGWRDQLFDPNGPLPDGAWATFIAPLARRLKLAGRRRSLVLLSVLAAVGTFALVRWATFDPYDPKAFELAGWLARTCPWMFADYWLMPERIRLAYAEARPSMYPTAILFALAVPVIITGGALTYCAMRERQAGEASARAGAPHRALAALSFALTLVFAGYVAVSYGALFYDFVAVRVLDKSKCLPVDKPDVKEASQSTTILDCFLVGRFDKWYILLGWQRAKGDPRDIPPLYVKQVDVLEPFALLTGGGVPVRSILRDVPVAPAEDWPSAQMGAATTAVQEPDGRANQPAKPIGVNK